MSLRADLRLGEPARRHHKLSASLYRHDLDRQSPGIGFLVPPSIEKTRYTRTRAEWATGLLTTRLLHLNAGVDLDHESARNESVFQLPVFLGGDYDSSRTTPGAFAELIVEPGHLVLVFRFSWKMTVLKIRYTHEKRSCHEQTTPSSHRRAESRAVTPARSGEKASLGGMQRGRNPAEPVLHVAKGAIGWSPYGVFDPSRAEPRE